jgi:hypothetical protein
MHAGIAGLPALRSAAAQPSGEAGPGSAREIAAVVDGAQDVTHAGGNVVTDARQPNTAAPAVDQRGPERHLEDFDLHRQCRLRNRAGCGSAPETAVAREGVEVAKLPIGTPHHQTKLSQRSESQLYRMT